jgi:probable F420-dependent oxidoreductase
MKLSAQFPTRFIGNDPSKIKDWAQAAEDLGYEYIEVPDHVFGAQARDGWTPNYSEHEHFHETFVTLGFLAACTKTIRLSSGVLILPQRQTGVVAKQAAEADLLSGGRLRLGIGVGWNHIEYQALETDWKTRGAKQAEQIEVMRLLWSEELVTFKGRFHYLDRVNIIPGPVQRPIPIWLGGIADPVVQRAARLADGWMPIMPPGEKAEEKLAQFRGYLAENGRRPEEAPIEVWLRAAEMNPEQWGQDADYWRQHGIAMAMLYPMFHAGNIDGQIDILRRFKEVAEG